MSVGLRYWVVLPNISSRNRALKELGLQGLTGDLNERGGNY